MSIDSGRDYQVAVCFDTPSKAAVVSEVKKVIDSERNEDENFIKEHSIKDLPEAVIYIKFKARQYMTERFKQLGVTLPESQIVDPLFVDQSNHKIFEERFKISSTARGFYSVFSKRPLVFIDDIESNVKHADDIYHEMFHCAGVNIVAVDEKSASLGRNGFSVAGFNLQNKSWLFEEGLAVYESVKFREELSSKIPDQFNKDFNFKKEIVNQYTSIATKINNKIKVIGDDNQTEISPKYLVFQKGKNLNDSLIGINEPYSLAGEFINTMVNNVPEKERENFMKTIFIARNDPKQISKLAHTIDNYFGKGMYVKILKCEPEGEKIYNLIKQIESKK